LRSKRNIVEVGPITLAHGKSERWSD